MEKYECSQLFGSYMGWEEMVVRANNFVMVQGKIENKPDHTGKEKAILPDV